MPQDTIKTWKKKIDRPSHLSTGLSTQTSQNSTYSFVCDRDTIIHRAFEIIHRWKIPVPALKNHYKLYFRQKPWYCCSFPKIQNKLNLIDKSFRLWPRYNHPWGSFNISLLENTRTSSQKPLLKCMVKYMGQASQDAYCAQNWSYFFLLWPLIVTISKMITLKLTPVS